MAGEKLQAYRAKRDFSRTGEPSGERTPASASRLRFVIQKHAATRLHYDLRLELDGVFKSWAVTKGPSLDPHDRRLAVEVEDHPLDYGDFEGTIPKGQYGGGTVLLWDRGYWEAEGLGAEAGLAKGDFKFRLEGEKLHGSWVLVRIKNDRTGGKRTNWLLIKHRDEWARDGGGEAVLEDDRSVASGRAMEEIAAGIGRAPAPFITEDGEKVPGADAVWDSHAGLVAPAEKPKKARPAKAAKIGPMPEFFAPQLAATVERPPSGPGWAHEIKFDGYRMQLRVEGGRAALRTRKGLDWTDKFAAIGRAGGDLPDCIVDGEAVALNAEGAPDFAALQAALSEGKTDRLVYFAFDLLFADGADWRERPLKERKARLAELLKGYPSTQLRFVEHFETGGDAVLLSACRMSLEGIVSKRLDAPYREGRGESWVKAKCRAGHEVVIGGWTTTGQNFRSLLVGTYQGDRFVYVGRVGTGYGAAKVAELLPRLQRGGAGEEPVHRRQRTAQGRRNPLDPAGAGRRDRVRRLDGRRAGPTSRVQGPAGGQAGRGGPSGDAGGPGEGRNARARGPKAVRRRDPTSSWASPSPAATSRCGRRRARTAPRSPNSTSPATTRRSAPGCCRTSRAGPARWCATPTALTARNSSSGTR